MFKKLSMLVVRGLLAFLPLSLTIYLLFWLVTAGESLLTPFIPKTFYFPGMGLATGIVILILLGMAVKAYFVRAMIASIGRVVEKIPVIKTVYGSIHDAVNLININKQQQMESVVSVKMSDSIHLIGFVTNQTSAQKMFNDSEKLGVYIPMSYQIGGYTLYINKNQLTPLDIDVETAMRIALTGGNVSSGDSAPFNTHAKPTE